MAFDRDRAQVSQFFLCIAAFKASGMCRSSSCSERFLMLLQSGGRLEQHHSILRRNKSCALAPPGFATP